MANPCLIIGVGGTGQWIVAHIKKNLLDTYGKVPEQVKLIAFDTTDQATAQVGGWGVSTNNMIKLGQAGTVDILGEHAFIGGDAKDLVDSIYAGKEKSISTWFDAEYFKKQCSPSVLNLTKGAGAFRPLGRLALFLNLHLGANSLLNNKLDTAIAQIKEKTTTTQIEDKTTTTTLYVFITGSMTGGTGSGMYADMAHLVRQIAKKNQISAKVRGYFILPQAFDGTVKAPLTEVRNQIVAKSFASMRENNRFASEFNYAEGYPMVYDERVSETDEVLHGKVRNTLFELLYYFDGSRSKNSLEHVQIEYGVAPVIAEAITSMIDKHAGYTLEEHKVNLDAYKGAMGLTRDDVTVGTFGSYSWVLPMYSLVEGWSYRLASEALDLLLKHSQPADDVTRALTELTPDWPGNLQGEDGEAAALSFWNRDRQAACPAGIFGGRGHRGHGSPEARDEIIKDFKLKVMDDWFNYLKPGITVQNKQVEDARLEIPRLLQIFLSPQKKGGGLFDHEPIRKARIPTSDTLKAKEERKKYALGADRIHGEAKTFLSNHVKQLNDQLVIWVDWQVADFRNELEAYTKAILNGTDPATKENGVRNRAGKLGHLQAVLKAMSNDLQQAKKAIEDVKKQKLNESHRSQLEVDRQNQYEAMKRDNSVQERYLQTCQKILETDRLDLVIGKNIEAIKLISEYIDMLNASVERWIKTLAKDSHGLYASVRKGRLTLETNRKVTDTLVAVRKVISDETYEEERYRNYISTPDPALGVLLNDWEWNLEKLNIKDPQTGELHPYLEIQLKIKNVPNEQGHLQDKILNADPDSQNLDILINRCQSVFASAFSNESITNFLLKKYRGKESALADEIFERCGTVLKHSGRAYPANYLQVYKDPEQADQIDFLQKVVQQLAKNAGVLQQNAAQLLGAEDRFRLTLTHYEELIKIEDVAAYKEGEEKYKEVPAGSRPLLHIFPAECRAAKYEATMKRILPHRVVLLLEDVGRFGLAVSAWMYGQQKDPAHLIHEYSYTDAATQNPRHDWVLSIVPPKGTFDETGQVKQLERYFLTDLAKEELLDALETFVVGKQAKRYQYGNDPISDGIILPDEEAIGHEVETLKEQDAEYRFEKKILGTKAPAFQGKLNANLRGKSLKRVRSMVAEFEKVMETIHERIDPRLKELKEQKLEGSQEYALYQLLKTYLEMHSKELMTQINKF